MASSAFFGALARVLNEMVRHRSGAAPTEEFDADSIAKTCYAEFGDGLMGLVSAAFTTSQIVESTNAPGKLRKIGALMLAELLSRAGEAFAEYGEEKVGVRDVRMTGDLWACVLRHADSSIWTTNVRDPAAAHGRKLGERELALQSLCIGRGLNIRRVFVYERIRQGEGDRQQRVAELVSLGEVIDAQTRAGVVAYVIESRKFEALRGDTDRLGSDFMLVDDSLVYVTERKNEVVSSYITSNARYVHKALEARDMIMTDAQLVAEGGAASALLGT